MSDLNRVVVGPAGAQQIIGYVDEWGAVYDLGRRRLGGVGIQRDGQHVIVEAGGTVAGFVDVASDASGRHRVYDGRRTEVGAASDDGFADATSGQTGTIAFDQAVGGGGNSWLLAAAALLLILRRPAQGATPSAREMLDGVSRLARGWVVEKIAGGDEAAVQQAEDKLKRAGQGVMGAMGAISRALGQPTPTVVPADPPVMPPGSSSTEPPAQPAAAVTGSVAAQAVEPPDVAAGPPAIVEALPAEPVGTAPAQRSPGDAPRPSQGGGRAAQYPPSTDAFGTIAATSRALAADHAAHLAERQRAARDGTHLDPAAGQRVEAVVGIVQSVGRSVLTFFTVTIEMIRPFDGYGPGDVAVAIEGIAGRTIDGLRLSRLERIFYIVAAALPFVPGRPVVGVYRRIEPWTRSEDTLAQRGATHDALRRASGRLGGAGWNFLLGQLPPGLRSAVPDPKDPRYPRSASFRTYREVAGLLWLPFIAYFAIVAIKAGELIVRSNAHLWALLDTHALAHIFLLDAVIAPAQQQPLVVLGALALGFLAFLGVLVVGQACRMDRVRGTLVLAVREILPQAHAEVVGRVNATVWQSGTTMGDKVTQSVQHLQDVSLKTAKRIMLKVLGWEALHLAVSLALAIAATIVGVVLVVTGVA